MGLTSTSGTVVGGKRLEAPFTGDKESNRLSSAVQSEQGYYRRQEGARRQDTSAGFEECEFLTYIEQTESREARRTAI